MIRSFLSVFIFYFFYIEEVKAQTITSSTTLHDNGAISLGSAQANLFLKDTWSAVNAIANTADVKHPSLSLSHRWNFQLLSVSTIGFSSIYPLKNCVVSFSAQRFGDIEFNEQAITLGLSHSLGIIQIGGSINFYQIGGDYLQKLHAYTFNFGINASLSPKISLSFHTHNFLNQGYENQEVDILITSLFKLGIQYTFDDYLSVVTQLDKATDQVLISRTSLHYQLSKYLNIYTGIALFPLVIGFGSSVQLNRWNIDYGFQIHQVLPWSHCFTLRYGLTKK